MSWAAKRRYRDAIGTGLLALVLVLPSVAYNAVVFGPTSAEDFAQSQDILAHFRIPHHTEVKLWCDGIALVQVAWMFLGLFLVRGQRLFPAIAIPLVAAVGLTLLQLATDSDSLALLFPWRASVYLVPVATTVILARLLATTGTSFPIIPGRSRRVGGCPPRFRWQLAAASSVIAGRSATGSAPRKCR